MDARIARALVFIALIGISMGARRSTPNFVVETTDSQACERISQAAEYWRRELAISWLGQAMPDWSAPCRMTVTVGPNLGAGGATTFQFDRGEVFGWRMNIQGSLERVLDSVLPHEVTHMVFASHFRQPVPRWADEGGATSVEHSSEKMKHHHMLVQFLQTGRGIAFNQMFAMTDYPRDVMPLYAQGFSLAEYLIEQGGRRRYVEFLGEGMRTEHWGEAIQHYYGLTDLGVLQNTWLAWVKEGSPALAPRPEQAATAVVAQVEPRPRPEPNLVLHLNKDGSAVTARPTSGNAGQTAGDWRAAEPQSGTAQEASPGPALEQAARPQPINAP